MKTTLIFLSTLAIILGVFTYFAVFGASSGTYNVTPLTSGTSASGTAWGTPSSTVTSTIPTSSLELASGTPQDQNNSGTNFYGSTFPSPALTWTDGGAKFAINAVVLQENQLIFTLTIQMGPSPACVPLDIRLVADESGDLQGPDTPSFSFPDSGDCNGAPGESYTNQTATFTVNPGNLPLLFTTGGSANIFFDVATSTSNGLNIYLPSTSG